MIVKIDKLSFIIISNTILTAFTLYTFTLGTVKKIFAVKSKKIAFYAALIAAFVVSLIYLIAVYTTAKYAAMIKFKNLDMVLTYIVANLFNKPMLVVFIL